MPDETIIRPSDPQAASFRTVEGWVSRHGRYFGNDGSAERIARYDGSTHSECEKCGATCSKGYTACSSCMDKKRRERWLALPEAKEWDYPVALLDGDEYFFDPKSIATHCDANLIAPEDLMLVVAEPQHLREIDDDHWSDEMPEDYEPPDVVKEAVKALNAVLREHGRNACYLAGDERVSITWEDIGGVPFTEK